MSNTEPQQIRHSMAPTLLQEDREAWAPEPLALRHYIPAPGAEELDRLRLLMVAPEEAFHDPSGLHHQVFHHRDHMAPAKPRIRLHIKAKPFKQAIATGLKRKGEEKKR